MIQIQEIDIKLLETNKGQVEGLPRNPRTIKNSRYKALKKSIEDAPEMLSLRELIVYPFEGRYVIIAGNMRHKASLELGFKSLPCKVLPKETPVEKLREYSIKDNVSFGSDDMAALEAFAKDEFMKYCYVNEATQQVEHEPTAIQTKEVAPPSDYIVLKFPVDKHQDRESMTIKEARERGYVIIEETA